MGLHTARNGGIRPQGRLTPINNTASNIMIFELRTYTARPGRAPDFLKLYEAEAFALQNKYLGGLVGFYVTEIGPLSQIVHLWRYASLADREQRRTALEADPAWDAYRAHSKELGALAAQETKILKPTSFSPQ